MTSWGKILKRLSNNSRKYFRLVILVLIGFLFIRCAAFLPFNRPLPMLSPDELLEKINLHFNKLETFHGKALIQVQTQYGAMKGTIELISHQPDSIWLKIEGPMGLDMGIMRMFDGDVLFYSPWENILYSGSLHQMALFNQFNLEWDPQQIMMGILGLMNVGILNDTLINYQVYAKHYVFDYSNGSRYWVDPKGPVISKLEILKEGTSQITWNAEEFRNKNGVRLPRLIDIQKHDTGEKFSLTYFYTKANIKLDKDWHQIPVPEGVMKIEL